MVDARKSLPMLREEWASCQSCDLGVRRVAYGGEFIFGEGQRRGVMFVGEGPGKDEEEMGRPFIGESGTILRTVINRLGLQNFYITNIVACRSCTPWTGPDGQPMMRKNWKTKQMEVSYKDEAPTPLQIEACQPRLYEEIYLVDPIIIVALGPTAAKTLLRKSVSITAPDVRGVPVHITIPGAGFTAVRTEKREAWLHKTKGVFSLPTVPNEVRYLCLPTLHPAFVSRKLADPGGDSPLRQFAGDVQKAVQIYERYMLELFGTVPSGNADVPVEIHPDEIYPQE
jgi:uracil-DNA glycosylase